MSGSDLKKVKPGEPFRPSAARENAWTEAARAHREGDTQARRPRKQRAGTPGVVEAYNASAEKAPAHGVVQVCEAGATQAQVEFCKPGEYEDAPARYGVTMESVPPGHIGRIALSGGPWRVLCSWHSPTAADTIGPADGYWSAYQGDVMQVVRGKAGTEDKEIVLAFFKRGGENALYHPANTRTIIAKEPPDDWGYFQLDCKQTYNGSSWDLHTDVFVVGRFNVPVPFTYRQRGLLYLDNTFNITVTYYTDYDGGGDGTGTESVDCYMSMRFKIIAEDFDLSTLTKDRMVALKGQSRPVRFRIQGGALDTDYWPNHVEDETAQYAQIGREMYGHDEDWTIYGVALYGAPDEYEMGYYSHPSPGDLRYIEGHIGGAQDLVFTTFKEHVTR